MMTVGEDNADKTRRYYEALWNERDRSVIADWIAPEYVGHFSRRPDPIVGVAGFSGMAEELFTAFPDVRMTIEDLVAEGDRVASRVRLTGTHRGPMEGYAPTGARVDTQFAAIERYLNGLCVEEWVFSDDLGIAR
jgi:predicted ester cyclase